MTEDIVRMARQAHHELVTQDYPGHAGQLDPWTMRLLEHFATLVRADERESCARVCDARYMGDNNREDMEARRCAAAIRARGITQDQPLPEDQNPSFG